MKKVCINKDLNIKIKVDRYNTYNLIYLIKGDNSKLLSLFFILNINKEE